MSSAKEETDGQIGTKVTGTIPDWVEGHMMRNGAAQWDIEHKGKTETVNHWFDGHRQGDLSLSNLSESTKSPVKACCIDSQSKMGRSTTRTSFSDPMFTQRIESTTDSSTAGLAHRNDILTRVKISLNDSWLTFHRQKRISKPLNQ